MTRRHFTTLIAPLGLCALTAFGADNGTDSDPFTASLLRVAKPVDTRVNLFSPKDFIEKSFTHDELLVLSNQRGLASCRTRMLARKNHYSNYLFDSGNCAPDYVAPDARLDSVFLIKTATNRMLYRVASDHLRRNPTLTALVNGKIDFDFSFSDLMQKIDFSSPDEDDTRPVYVLHVNHLANNLGLNLSDVEQKKIIEQWPTRKVEPPTDPSLNEPSYAQQLARKYGLAHVPFTRYKLKLEKTAPGFVMTFNIRLHELNDLVYADLTSYVMHKDKKNIKYGYRLPYKHHAIGGDYAYMNADPVVYYSYTTPRGFGKFVYNTFNKAIGFELAMSI